MQCDDLGAQEIVTSSNASREREVDPAVVVDHAVYAPLTRAIEPVFSDFEPFEAVRGGRSCIVYLRPEMCQSSSTIPTTTPWTVDRSYM